MKQIVKDIAPDFFSKFVSQKQPKTWEDASPVRRELRKYILQEHGNCCAYTEVRINGEENCHIDHYRTRNLFPEKTFEYENLLVSDYIEFAFTGDVLPLEYSKKGENTISVFNLNEKSLLERRKTAALNVINMRAYLSEDELVIAIGEFEMMVRQLYKDCNI